MDLAFPHRVEQISQLSALLQNDLPLAGPVHVCGHSGTGKTSIVKRMLSESELPHAMVNCIECCGSDTLLFEEIFDQMCSDADSDYVIAKRCSNSNQFVLRLKEFLSDSATKRSCIVLDNAEYLRDLPSTTLAVLARLHEFVESNVVVVFISVLPWCKFAEFGTTTDPVCVYFPNYDQKQLCELLCRDRPADCDVGIYESYCDMLLQVFYCTLRDLNELRFIARQNYDKYAAILRETGDDNFNPHRVYREFKPSLEAALKRTYLRVSEHKQTVAEGEAMEAAATNYDIPFTSSAAAASFITGHNPLAPKFGREIVEFSYHAKYVLVAAYMASVIPPKLDRRLFTKHHGKQKKAQWRLPSSKSKSSLALHRSVFKAFGLERLVAIYQAFLADAENLELDPDAEDPQDDVLIQVSTLCTLGIIQRIGKISNLDNSKFKFAGDHDLMYDIACSLNIDLNAYLLPFINSGVGPSTF